jgi:hypothetical protein
LISYSPTQYIHAIATAALIRLPTPLHSLEINSAVAVPTFALGLAVVLFLRDTARYFETFFVAGCYYLDKVVDTDYGMLTRRLRSSYFPCHGGDSKRVTVEFDGQDPFWPLPDAVAEEWCRGFLSYLRVVGYLVLARLDEDPILATEDIIRRGCNLTCIVEGIV